MRARGTASIYRCSDTSKTSRITCSGSSTVGAEALRRLEGHGLVWWHERTETIGLFMLVRLRLTPRGLRVLGEWPPSEAAQLDSALVQVLLLLADDADELEAKPLRRAAGAVWRFAGDVVSDVAKGELKRMGGDVAS